MDERLKRLEQKQRLLFAGLIFLLVLTLVLARDFFLGEKWNVAKGVVTNSLTTNRIDVMEQMSPQPKPRVILFPMDAETSLSFIDSTRHEMLGVGIRKDQQLGEIPYISFHTKAGVQILEPDEKGKVIWSTR